MNRHRDIKFQLHISIHKGLSTPRLQKCKNCCHPAKFHCPFCLSSSFEPTNYSRARRHLDRHLKKSIHLQGYTVHRCRLGCRNQPHYHCVYCPATRIRNQDLNKHVLVCLQKRDSQSSQLHTKGSTSPAKDDILSSDISSQESCDDDDGDDLTVVTDRDHQRGRGASGSQRETPVVVQTVQTNSDKPQDCDEFYFMNLVKMFKKLSPQKKAEVRMKIERLLFEAEFD